MRRTIRGTSRELEDAARSMRRQPTPAEEVLWGALHRKQVAGLKFRRQHPVERFILDFYCPSHKLVIEVDGACTTSKPSAMLSGRRRWKGGGASLSERRGASRTAPTRTQA